MKHDDYVLDPTAGSGGFLLEALLQVWHTIDSEFSGRSQQEIGRLKYDFANLRVFGIEIHEILARLCKINLLLHHDGHTNVESNRSCLDAAFTNPRLQAFERFTVVVGNPPFGDEVEEGDEDKLGGNRLGSFELASNRSSVDSEQLILERSIRFLEPAGRLGFVVPDGLLNNQGEISNCPATRRLLATSGRILAIVSLPDYAFRKSGAQNKTSILFFQKFAVHEKVRFDQEMDNALGRGTSVNAAVSEAIDLAGLDYSVFLAEANWVGYSSTGAPSTQNDLYQPSLNDGFAENQGGTILGEWRRFQSSPSAYDGHRIPDCMALSFTTIWNAHSSSRLDPKYHLFERESKRPTPQGWKRTRAGNALRRRMEPADFSGASDAPFRVITLSQTGEIRARAAGKGNNPPEWLGSYLEDMSSSWYVARAGDVVYSSIDLWKGCIAVVPEEFDRALVTKEFPIYEVIDGNLSPDFLQILLRSRYYQRAFRAITTGHSNRRRTQSADFESLELSYPTTNRDQLVLIQQIKDAQAQNKRSAELVRARLLEFSDQLDGRGVEELPEVLDVADQDS